MLIDIKELGKYDIAISEIHYTDNIIKQPRLIETQQKRAVFIYIFDGEITFEAEGKQETCSSGDLIYFPHKCYRKMFINTPHTQYSRIDLALRINNEIALFSNFPKKIADFPEAAFKVALYELRDAYQANKNKLLLQEKMLKLLSILSNTRKKPVSPKLKAAIDYIDTNFTEKIDCRKLASMCYLSTAQFYNLFNEHLGQTPLQYRNSLLINKSRLALSSRDSTVAEVAEELGFSDVSYFSRFFKKQVGVSPSEYHTKNINY